MARRGEQLREHILFTAKDVFLEAGFERASMDVVAARAQTSKRSLYAHFDSKERLFLDVIEFVRGLFLHRIGTPGEHGEDPAEALAQFCARYLETLLYKGSIQMCRMTMAEAVRFPQAATRYFDLMFREVSARLKGYLFTEFDVTDETAAGLADRLLGQVLYPSLPRALFGIEPLATCLDADAPPPERHLLPARSAVADLLAPLDRR